MVFIALNIMKAITKRLWMSGAGCVGAVVLLTGLVSAGWAQYEPGYGGGYAGNQVPPVQGQAWNTPVFHPQQWAAPVFPGPNYNLPVFGGTMNPAPVFRGQVYSVPAFRQGWSAIPMIPNAPVQLYPPGYPPGYGVGTGQ